MAEVEHRPGDPVGDEPPYRRFCVEDGALWPCPERMASLPAAPEPERRQLEAAEERMMDRVGIGWHVEGCADLPYHQRTGGTVVDYWGEDDERVFLVLNWHRGLPVLTRLACADVEPAGIREFDGYGLEAHATGLAEFVGRGGGKDLTRLEWLKLAAKCMERALCPT